MSVHARIAARARGVDVALDVASGATLALLGENGSGKSTVLNAIAGLVRPDRGEVVVGGRMLFGVAPDGRGVDVPVHDRRVALLAQQPLLFPHLSARENVAFAPRSRGASRPAARAIADARLAEVGATELADARPGELSGGQAQRVALARALAAEPDLLLLDEPMSALDVASRDDVRRALTAALRGRTAIFVTHDPLDALLLADDAIVLDRGRVAERGAPRDLLAAPQTPFAARLAGVALVSGVVHDEATVTVDGHRVRIEIDLDRPHGGFDASAGDVS